MISTAGHIKKYHAFCSSFFEKMHLRGTKDATIQEFIYEVEKEAFNIQDEDVRKTFKGDMLEILSEVFFCLNKTNPAVGLKDYKAVCIEEDYGVDATGTNANNNDCAVQVKYRHNPKDSILYSEIARTYASGRLQLNLPLDTANSIYIFTTAYEVTPACQAVFGDIIRVINRNIIESQVNNNAIFWEEAFKAVLDVLYQPDPIPVKKVIPTCPPGLSQLLFGKT
jgi:hypothetical protein